MSPGLTVARFGVTLYGQIWVTPEGQVSSAQRM